MAKEPLVQCDSFNTVCLFWYAMSEYSLVGNHFTSNTKYGPGNYS